MLCCREAQGCGSVAASGCQIHNLLIDPSSLDSIHRFLVFAIGRTTIATVGLGNVMVTQLRLVVIFSKTKTTC